MAKILLVEPDFPVPAKSKNHKNFLPIGLLKIASYLRQDNEVKLVRGVPKTVGASIDISTFDPDEIWVTSLFTYWSKYVKDAISYYKKIFPRSKVIVGGIYASLRPRDEVIDYTGADEVYQGIMPEAEKLFPAYDLVSNGKEIDYQIVHASRGCSRKCQFCGTWIIEPEFIPERSIKDKIKSQKLVFYDNNLLMNPYVENILSELAQLKKEKKIKWCESQSGFDGRLILMKPHLAKMIKDAGFRYPRIAWDWKYSDHSTIKSQLDLLIDAGYKPMEIYVFVLYNWDISFEEMEMKRMKCWEWKVQMSDCRFRPLYQLHDDYNPRKKNQSSEEYYIHKDAGWTDSTIKAFRHNVRRQNICIRENIQFYSSLLERKHLTQEEARIVRNYSYEKARLIISDAWDPSNIEVPQQKLDKKSKDVRVKPGQQTVLDTA